MIDVTLPLRALPINQAHRAIPRGNYCTNIKSAKYRQFEEDALTLLPKKKTVEGEVEVTIEYYFKTRVSVIDIDNLNKVTLDVLEKAEYFENDNKITALHCYKYKAEEDKIHIIITEA